MDNFSAYVGQSRSKLPTHTWNVARVIEADFGGALAERRRPDEQVLAAMERVPLKTFAAGDDPWVIDRRLSAELAEHREVIDTRPPDRTKDLVDAKRALSRAGEELNDAHALMAGTTERLDAIGPVARLRREGRQAHDRAASALDRATDGLDSAQHQLTDARMQVRALEQAVSERTRWDSEHGWRLHEVTRIQAELDSHWAGVILGAVREHDPLAFGIERLRSARVTYAGELQEVLAALPPERSRELLEARRDLAAAQQRLTSATKMLTAAEASHVTAHQRRRGRRDRGAMATSSATLQRARDGLTGADERVSACLATLNIEQQMASTSDDALAAAAPETTRLKSVLAELDHALDITRPQRILAVARSAELPEHLNRILGPLPPSRGGQRVWCALASEVEADRDCGAASRSRRREHLAEEPDGWATTNPSRSRSSTTIDRRVERLLAAGAHIDPEPASALALRDSETWFEHLRVTRDYVAERSRHLERSDMGIELGR